MGLFQDFSPTIMDGVDNTLPFPIDTKKAAAEINGVKTDIMSMSFSDKIMIVITQDGRLAQWVTVPLLSDNPTDSDPFYATSGNREDSLLPTVRFQPRTLFGAGSSDREVMGHLFASQIASMITTQRPDEQRQLLLGLGLAKVESDREVFLAIVNLALQVI